MEFRTVQTVEEREATLDLLHAWLGDREFFARYFRHDPSYRDDLCFVALDSGRIVSTLQVFRKRVRCAGVSLEVAGVGNVFTKEAYRTQGVSSRLIEMAVAAMDQHGFDLSLLFASRLAFYGRHGWLSQPRHFHFVSPVPSRPSRYTIRPFAPDDLEAVMGLYSTSNEGRAGTVVRDQSYWRGQLRYAGNPSETFLVACDRGQVVAYARATNLYELYVMIEHGYAQGGEVALVDLIAALTASGTSGASGMLTQLSIAPRVLDELAAAGATASLVEDYFWMWRVISASRLAAKLGVSTDEVESEAFLPSLFPAGSSVYWLADRF